ncbi:hypothetical protein amrb99_96210 [Actinomadura sp. RB99]|nr:hypothetical protein [Actinomadura sp. RB99]
MVLMVPSWLSLTTMPTWSMPLIPPPFQAKKTTAPGLGVWPKWPVFLNHWAWLTV